MDINLKGLTFIFNLGGIPLLRFLSSSSSFNNRWSLDVAGCIVMVNVFIYFITQTSNLRGTATEKLVA
ncbi:unnamed protein product [Amaranthus hypochondriacus]